MNTSDLPEELYYLDPAFNVRSLRKHQLKDILSAHNIPYHSTTTKVELISLFKSNIEARRDELIEEYKRNKVIKANSESTQTFGRGHRTPQKPVKLEDEQAVRGHVKAAAKKKPVESFLKKDKDGFAIPSSPKRHSTKATPKFAPEDSFDEGEESQSDVVQHKVDRSGEEGHTSGQPKSSLRRFVPTTFKESPSEPRRKKTVQFGSPTYHSPSFNPEDSFASSDEEQEAHTDKKAIVHERASPKPVSKELHSKAKEPIPSTSKVQSNGPKPIVLSDHLFDDDEDDSEYLADSDETDDDNVSDDDEEVVDETELNTLYKERSIPVTRLLNSEHHMLTRAQKLAAAKQTALRWKAKFQHIGFIFGLAYMIIATIGLFFTSYARQQNGYCESASTDKDVSFIFSLLPSPCIPCPDHGTCSHGDLQCDPIYERRRPFYNIGGVLPIADECIHNSIIGKQVSRVEKRIKKLLAYEQGQAVCKHLTTHPDASPKDVPILRISVQDTLKDVVESMRPQFLSEQVNEIMYIALAAVMEDPEVHVWEIDDKTFFGTTRASYTIGCHLKRLYATTPINVKIYILLLISVLAALYGTSRDFQRSRQYKKKIDELVKQIINKLKEQYDNHTKDPKTFASPALPVSQIRSQVLDVNNQRTIEDWQRVVQRIQDHPHIRKSFQEVRGDPVEYWELTP